MKGRMWPRCPECGKDLTKNHWWRELYDCINMDCPLYYRKFERKDKTVHVVVREGNAPRVVFELATYDDPTGAKP